MSNELAIATVTAALGQKLSDAFAADLGFAATVTTVRPNAADTALPTTGANIFLFLATPNAANRNVDLPTRRADQTLLRQPTVALDLHYLISFYGDETQLEPQILLASTVLALHETPVLTSDTIQSMLATNRFPSLQSSNLADALDQVRFTPAALSLEELSKLWSVVFQTPYVLSVIYLAGAVFINHDSAVAASLPVRKLGFVAGGLQSPSITSVVAQSTVSGKTTFAPLAPILANGVVALFGFQLTGDDQTVQIDGVDVTTTAVTATQITLTLPATLLAGAHGVQVVRTVDFQPPQTTPPAPVTRTAVESNVATFVLQPNVTAASYTAGTSPSISVTVSPSIAKTQRVRLLLNQVGAAAGATALSFAFSVASRGTTGNPDATLSIPVTGVTAGTYFVRVEVDGAQSTQPLSAAYMTPTVTVS
jgi:hypothetical protein